MSERPPDRDPESLTYEQLLEELERTIARMSTASIGIEEAADLYERAGRLHAIASERLARVQERIDRLTGGAAGSGASGAGEQ